ncbi:hypothetical protein [Thermogymnomonas acidicola]|uniref:hypothetical protein n=1 Tax=Thermogymnomonas acidicola TaxID=399579 RepID=UPI0014949FBA|nr:hypothetical protein [Thermogymnomonas acidicola]
MRSSCPQCGSFEYHVDQEMNLVCVSCGNVVDGSEMVVPNVDQFFIERQRRP